MVGNAQSSLNKFNFVWKWHLETIFLQGMYINTLKCSRDMGPGSYDEQKFSSFRKCVCVCM
jgi:hypothetical protein